MWPDRVSNPGPLTYESGALSTALRGPAYLEVDDLLHFMPSIKPPQHFVGLIRHTCSKLAARS